MTPPLPPQLDRDHEADLIRAALALQADRAPDPGPVLAALAVRPQRTRRLVGVPRSAVGVAAGLATAAAVAGIAVVAGPGPASVPAPSRPAAPATAASPGVAAAQLAAPLRYSPSWLPDGLQEYERGLSLVPAGHTLNRTWVRRTPPQWQPGGARLDLVVRSKPSIPASDGVAVTVGGLPGRYVGGGRGDQKILLEWQPQRGVWLVLAQVGLGLDRGDVLRIAESMRPDPGAYGLPVQVGPAQRRGFAHFSTKVDGRGGWRAEVALPTLTVRLGTTGERDAPTWGQPVRVGGRQARYTVVPGNPRTAWLVVPLDGGRVLTLVSWPQAQAPLPDKGGTGMTGAIEVNGPVLSEAEMVAVAETVDTTVVPDITWGG